MKNPVQKKPVKNSRERDQFTPTPKILVRGFTVVLEAIHSDFRVFGEKLELTDRKVGSIEKKIESMDKKIDILTEESAFIREEITDMKFEIAELRGLLSQKADLDRLKDFERRIKRVEELLEKK